MGDNLLVNGDFQGTWETVVGGNQTPNGWTVTETPQGQPMLWPNKAGWQGGNRVTFPAIAERTPEIKHVLQSQLPPHEHFGQPRSLLPFETMAQVLKRFHGPSSGNIHQTVQLTAGRKVKLAGYLLPDTEDIPRGPDGRLEDTHCIARVSLRSVDAILDSDQRNYGAMRSVFDVQGNVRPWNRFMLVTTVPGDGRVSVNIETQQNWGDDPSGVAWFYGPFWLEYPDGVEPAPQPIPSPEIERLQAELTQLRLRMDALTGALAARKQIALDVLDVMRFSARKMADELDAAYAEAQKLGDL